jgi:hypothetical protein
MNERELKAFIIQSQEARDLWIPRKIRTIYEPLQPLQFYRDHVGTNVPLIIKGYGLIKPRRMLMVEIYERVE